MSPEETTSAMPVHLTKRLTRVLSHGSALASTP
jgi:hypothetical protein